MIRQYLAADGYAASMQNCINEERLASVMGWGRTLGIIVGGGVGVDLYEPGHIRRGYATPSRRHRVLCRRTERTHHAGVLRNSPRS